MKIIKILNAFCGIGGNRLFIDNLNGFDYDLQITAIDSNQNIIKAYKDEFPNDKTIIGDAYDHIQKNFQEYDIIWASPPCQTHSRLTKMNKRQKLKPYPDLRLYSLIIFLENWFHGFYIVENTIPYYNRQKPLIDAYKIDRHLFWSNIELETKLELYKLRNFTKQTQKKHKEYMDKLKNYFGIYLKKNIYFKPNHDPAQVYRNCIDPFLGYYLFQQLINVVIERNGFIKHKISCMFYDNTTCLFELAKYRINIKEISYDRAKSYAEINEICYECLEFFG